MKTTAQPPLDIRNTIPFADGTLVSEFEDGHYYVGFRDLFIWVPKLQKRICLTAQDEDKFIVTSNDRCECWNEFWTRWSIFCKRAYKTDFISIERR